MKKLFIFMGALLLGVGAFGVSGKKAVRAGADNASEVVALLNSAKDANGKYTKKTQIFLKTEAVKDIETHFHAGVKTLQLSTYYNETLGALLMGDYNGGFSYNSGYINEGENAVRHFTYANAATKDVDDLFTARTDGWKAEGQTVGGYYQTLGSLATVAGSASWEKFDLNGYTVYKHAVGTLTITDGAYNDPVLNAFQYFAAPMLLRDDYISYNGIWVTEATSFLSIRLYATKSDYGKSTVAPGDNDVLISEARVYKGLSFTPEAKWYLKGSFDSWDDGIEMEYAFDAYNPEQYEITRTCARDDLLRITNGSSKYGYDNIPASNQEFFYRYNGGEYDNCFIIKANGEYKFFLQPSVHVVNVNVPNITFDIPLDFSVVDWTTANALIYAYVWNNSGNAWFKMNSNKVSIEGFYTNLILVRKDPAGGDNANFDDHVWNQTEDLEIQHGMKLKLKTWSGGAQGKTTAEWVSAA